ncbi:MAG TPA: HypC/HybG/HupF family hydrogenase formation chaperone [Conexibacter sp.]|nr:HypC/HybG/HupF family hydrogenase formation chaperone [Conexibacter sp.]
MRPGDATQPLNPRPGAGVVMRVLALDPCGSRARCAALDGIPLTIETALVGGLEPGAMVLVQAGVALARLDVDWGL